MLPPRPQSGDKAEASSASTLSSPVPGHRQQKPAIITSLLTLPTSRAQRAECAQMPPLRPGFLGRGLAHECRQEPVRFYS